MCGGSTSSCRSAWMLSGLSPRVRGKHRHSLTGIPQLRSIPACAGEASLETLETLPDEVYPRVCGGSAAPFVHIPPRHGLSPRVRGKHVEHRLDGFGGRSIPACAGEAAPSAASGARPRVYPRVCGGSGADWRRRRVGRGLSPRVRGKLLGLPEFPGAIGSIPACAGEAYRLPAPTTLPTVYPRVCGGSSAAAGDTKIELGLSPRVRGKPGQPAATAEPAGSIPACAGEAYHIPHGLAHQGVYPRVCGGSVRPVATTLAAPGLSPRVRGKLALRHRHTGSARSIPACAGEAPLRERK